MTESSQEFLKQPQLPTILCLHGAGTNGTIFRLQARMLVRKLISNFRFTFLDAPFESEPGPGVLPTYEGMGPYKWWHCDESALEAFDITAEEVSRRRQKVRALLAAQLEDESIVGIMAFSQGARVATGLCLDDELGNRIKFAIIIAATFPAMKIGENKKQNDLPPTEPLAIPSVHVQGMSDPWASEGRRLRDTYFTEAHSHLITFYGGHIVPVATRDVEKVVKAIMAAWEKAQRRVEGIQSAVLNMQS